MRRVGKQVQFTVIRAGVVAAIVLIVVGSILSVLHVAVADGRTLGEAGGALGTLGASIAGGFGLGTFLGESYVRRSRAAGDAIWTHLRGLHRQVRDLLEGHGAVPGADADAVRVNLWVHHRAPRHWYRKRLTSVAHLSLNRPPGSDIAWTSGRGLTGRCWETGRPQGRNLTFYGDVGSAGEWTALPDGLTTGLSWDTVRRLKKVDRESPLGLVLVVPVSRFGLTIGCLSIDLAPEISPWWVDVVTGAPLPPALRGTPGLDATEGYGHPGPPTEAAGTSSPPGPGADHPGATCTVITPLDPGYRCRSTAALAADLVTAMEEAAGDVATELA